MKLDLAKGLRTMFGYDVVDSSATHRRRSASDNKGEDQLLDYAKRRRLVETARDGQRNFSLLQWLVSKHLDYTCSFQFRVRSGNREFDRLAERAVERWAASCDVSRRHPFRRQIRLFRSGQIVDGDALLLKVKGGRLQIFESDRIAKPSDLPQEYAELVNRNGLVLDDYGAVSKFCLCKRDERGMSFALLADAANCRFDGFFKRYDQTRGISPLACALMQSEDLYEALNFNLIKAKLAALFGLKITRKGSTRGFDYGDQPEGTQERRRYDIQARPGFVLDMDPDDDISLVASNTPSSEFQSFTVAESRLILASLGMPYSMFDSSGCSYSGLRGDYQQYLSRVKDEREDVKATLYDITDWVLPVLVSRGDLRLPDGIALPDLLERYDWMPTGSLMLDPSKETAEAATAIQNGLTSRTRACSTRGEDFYAIVDEIAEEEAYAKEKGVALSSVPVNIRTTEDQQQGTPQ